MMKISCASVLFPELPDLGEIARRVADAGYDGVDWRVQTDYHVAPATLGERADEIRGVCDEHGLRIATLRTYAAPSDLAVLETARDAAIAMGCEHVRIGGWGYDGQEDFRSIFARATRELEGVADLFRGSGVRALIEVHFGTIHASAGGTLHLLEHVEPEAVGVIADPSNMVVEGGEEWAMAFDMLWPYLCVVDVRNSRWVNDGDQGAWRWEWAPLDEGRAPWPAILGLLIERGFDGWLTNENIFQVPTSSTGYIGERHDSLGGYVGERSIEERLADIGYLRSLAEREPAR
jgi:sugar phosphate isomerase/epimerase